MPWTAANRLDIITHLNLAYSAMPDVVLATDAITDEQAIVKIQSLLTELNSIDTQLATVATSGGIKELVGDIVFETGGATTGLLRRQGSLISRLQSLLNLRINYLPTVYLR